MENIQTNQIDGDAFEMIVTKSEAHIDLNNSKFYPEGLLKKKFRNLFITIPHTDIDYKTLHENTITNFKTSFIITCQEKHKDGDNHIHQLIIFQGQQELKRYHNTIASYNLRVGGTINYQSAKDINKVIEYIKKDNTYLIEGDEEKYKLKTGKSGGQINNKNTYKSYNEIKDDIYTNIITMILNGNTRQEVEEYIKLNQAREYILHNDKINSYLDKAYSNQYEKHNIETITDNTKLKEWQEGLFKLLHETPKARQIIWVVGDYGVGKSFMINYLTEKYKYGVYNAGQSVSYDNVVYGYKEEGLIVWDLPRNFDWDNLKNPLCNLVEKFSDVGQTLTSKKYTGNKVKVMGHTLVFSNERCPNELKHRTIKEIILTKIDDDKEEHNSDTGSQTIYIDVE